MNDAEHVREVERQREAEGLSVWQRHDVDDIRRLVHRVIQDRLAGAYLSATQREDLEAYLQAVAWELSHRYDPAKGSYAFSSFAYRILSRRVADWYRKQFCDARYFEPPKWVEFDEASVQELVAEWEWTDVFALVNVGALSPESQRALEQIARPMVEEGLTMAEVADRFGYSRRWASKALKTLREELERG